MGQLLRKVQEQPLAAKLQNQNTEPTMSEFLLPQEVGGDLEGNPKGLYAGVFFGTSQLNYAFDGEPIQLSSIDFGRGQRDSVITLADGVATLNPDASNQQLNLDAGLWLGYFPGFLTFDLGEKQKLAFGAMTQLGLSFNGGFGGWLGIGPEVMFASGPLSVNVGYGFGWTGTQRKLGNLQLEGIDQIIIESSSLTGCTAEDFSSESSFCRLHNTDSELYVIGSAGVSNAYARLGYSFGQEQKNGLGLVIGVRSERSSNVRYELWGPHEKIGGDERSSLSGPEMNSLTSNFGFSGLFVQIEFFTRPF
jgi:hypothetical protein